MKVRMQLMSDAIFGNGTSVPGGEDISILCDENGFPYYKGGTFKGIFREEMANYLGWTMSDENQIKQEIERLLGKKGDEAIHSPDKLIFSDFRLSDQVMQQMLSEIGTGQKEEILDALSHFRTFTALSSDGIVQEGSLRECRCINKGLSFYSEVYCRQEDEELEKLVSEVLSGIKWVGTMRNRGFGKVKLTIAGQGERCQNI